MSKFDNFQDFVASFSEYGDLLAIHSKPFIKEYFVTYAQLQANVYRAANYLHSIDLNKGDRLMIIASNSPEWVELFMAAQIIGVIAVSVDARSDLKSVEGYIKQTTPKVVFKSSYLLPELKDKYTVHNIEEVTELIKSCAVNKPTTKLSDDTDSIIVFTSGTTASPKGVLLSQRNILTNAHDAISTIAITSSWRLLSVLPLSHMYELTGGCLSVLAAGASIYYLEQVTPRAIASSLKDYKITTMLAIPELLSLFLDRIWQTAEANGQLKVLKSALVIAPLLPFRMRRMLFYSVHHQLGGRLNLIVTGGAPIPIDISKTWEKIGIHTLEGYGLTETSPILTLNPLEDNRVGTQGKPLPSVRLRINQEDNEVQTKGSNIFAGYWNNPKATKEAFTDDHWFKTGDTGKIVNGYLKIQGRLKFAIVLSSGLKVFPEDVELLTAKSTKLKECCIVGLHKPGGEEVQAVIISELNDKQVDEEIDKINEELQPFQAIRSWRRWREQDFPRTRLLKVDRAKVWKWANDQLGSKDNSEKSSSDQIINLISRTTNVSPSSIKETDRLTDIGLDSLRRLSLVSLIEEILGISVSEELINQKTTVAQLRRLIQSGETAETKPINPKWPYRRFIRMIGNGLRDSLVSLILRYWVKLSVEGRDNIKSTDCPMLIIFNHTDNFDGPIVTRSMPSFVRRRLAFAVAADVMDEHKVLALVARLFYGGFRFSRKEPYMPSLEYVGFMTARGWNIAISPEGRISTDGKVHEFKNGIGLLAAELGVPIVIVKTFGLYGTVPLHINWPQKRSKAIVRISQPITFNINISYEEITKLLHDKMVEL